MLISARTPVPGIDQMTAANTSGWGIEPSRGIPQVFPPCFMRNAGCSASATPLKLNKRQWARIVFIDQEAAVSSLSAPRITTSNSSPGNEQRNQWPIGF
jgi:hypothetical protein